MPLLKRRYIFEADDDNEAQANNAQGDEQSSADNAENGSDNDTSNDDNSSDDENNEEENTDEDTSDEDEDNADDEDYSIDADPDEEDDSGDEDEDSEDDSDSDEEEDTESDEEKQMDRDMFSTLSEEEQKRKIATLKRLFIDLYSKADSLIEKFNEVGTIDDENFAPIVKRILNILYDMKEYVSYYVLNIFDSSSYIENDITFNRYLAVLNGIKLAVDELLQEQKEEEAKKNKIQTSET